MKEKCLKTPRGTIHYWIKRHPDKNAACLIFLHGLTADHTLFDKQVPVFEKNYTVLSWDAPAHAKSRPYRDFSYMNGADDLNQLLDQENIPKAVFIGQSMGGYFIQAFLAKYPERVLAFIGIDTCPFGTSYYSKSDYFWLRQIGFLSSFYPFKFLKHAIAKQCTTKKESYQNMAAALTYYSKKEFCHLIGMGYENFITANFDLKISSPVLILVGEHDKTGKVLAYCKAWHKKEGYPLCQIQNAAHNSNYDNPEPVNRKIQKFLTAKGVPGSTPY